MYFDALAQEPNEDGAVVSGVPIWPETLIFGYEHGVFPWFTHDDGTGVWFSPWKRGVLDFEKMHLSQKDRRYLKRSSTETSPYRVTFDRAFEDVIRACAEVPRVEGKSWITEPFIAAYTELHRMGRAHSVEVWEGDPEDPSAQLVGGLYGVFLGGVFAGESMFRLRDNVGKVALWALIERLRANGHTWMDTQMVAGLAQKWGAVELPREEFLHRLRAARERDLRY